MDRRSFPLGSSKPRLLTVDVPGMDPARRVLSIREQEARDVIVWLRRSKFLPDGFYFTEKGTRFMQVSGSTSGLAKVLIAMPIEELSADYLHERFPGVSFVQADDATVPDEIGDATAIVCWSLSADAFERGESLQWVHVPAAGVEQILRLPGFVERDLLLTNGSGASAPNMAEHALALMLAFGRRLPWLQRSQEQRTWRQWGALDGVFELTDQTLVLVGLGSIGLEIAKRVQSFGVHVIGVRRSNSSELPANVDEIVTLADLDSVLARADHVVNSLPFTSSTKDFFDAGRFSAMKQGSYFYNLGRGKTVNQRHLIEALESGHLGGAGLDVTEPEPLPEDSPLWGMANVILTSHSSGHSPRMIGRRYELLCENIRRYLVGEPMINVVDQTHGY